MEHLCPHCDRLVDVTPQDVETLVACRHCGNAFTVPPRSGPEGAPCPRCGALLPAGTVLCVACGYHTGTGRIVGRVEETEAELRPAGLADALDEWVPGLFRPLIFLVSILGVLAAVFLAGFSVVLFGLGVWVTAFAVGMVACGCYAHAIMFILTGDIQTLNSGLGELEGRHWDLFLFLLLGPIILVFVILYVYLARQGGTP